MANFHSQDSFKSRPSEVNGHGASSLPFTEPRGGMPSTSGFSISKGDWVDTYSKNSSFQKKSMVDKTLVPLLNEALKLVSLPSSGAVLIADLGCSSGPNSIRYMSRVIKKLRERFPQADPLSPPLEFQAFFNDLPSNDFNNLFQLLNSENTNEFFRAGVPGSFHGRLFPRSAIHVFYSTSAIHYMSKVPDAVFDKASPAFNRGNWFVDDSNLAARAVYKEQASLDLKNFLHARAQELVPGGLLCFAGTRRSDLDPNKLWDYDDPSSYVIPSMREALHELASKGVISEEQIDYVNFPYFRRSIDEVRQDVMSFSSAYEVQMLKAIEVQTFKQFSVDTPMEAKESLKTICKLYRAIFAEFTKEHLREEQTQLFWECCEPIMERQLLPKIHEGKARMYFVALTRKATLE